MVALNNSNNTQVAKLSWLSSRRTRKAYGSMVVFFTKGSEAAKFLNERYMNVGGESALFESLNLTLVLPAATIARD